MTFKDGKEVSDEVMVKEKVLFSATSNAQYKFKSLNKLEVYIGSEVEVYYPIATKRNKKTAKISYGLGMKVYDSEFLEIFHASFYYFRRNQGATYIVQYNPKYDTFIRRKGEPFTYSVGCMDGYGCEGIFERIKEFFEDCPEVIEQIKKRVINNRDIITIANYYNENCGKK
jgi:hypothetical protein